MKTVNILAVGAHPDDVEIGAGGTIAKVTAGGGKAGIISLTEADLSSNGSVSNRLEEAERAASILMADPVITLNYPDRHLLDHRTSIITELTKLIRLYQPKIVLAPWHADRHPDHGHCAMLVKEAVFNAGIKKYLPDHKPWKPNRLYYYAINSTDRPHFAVDISSNLERKFEALGAFKSQFVKNAEQTDTPLNNGFLDRLHARDIQLGNQTGTKAAEGFFSDEPVLLHSITEEAL